MTNSFADRVAARYHNFGREQLVERIWAKDHTVWKPDPTELADRLGWLDVAGELRAEVDDLRAFVAEVAADGYRHVVVMGMGGSSLGPEVLRETFGVAESMLDLTVLDSTHPGQIREVEERIDLARTFFLASSKSGTTIETASQLAYFWARAGRGEQFAAITDAGSQLEALGLERGFRRVFRNRPDIGGRYSVLSHFGMVPAALIGAPVEEILDGALQMAERCRAASNLRQNPGVALGVFLGEAALAGRDKLTLLLPERYARLGWWIEQLVAESTGKEGQGILPIEGEAEVPVASYGADRCFVAYEESARARELRGAGHPVIVLEDGGLGGEFFRWEFATAVAGAILGVQPFDQPDVQAAKDAAGAVLSGKVPAVAPMALDEVVVSVREGDYVAINAFVPRNDANSLRLAEVRRKLGARLGVPLVVGFGPRFLHSTGQLHKGGPPSGAFIEVVDSPAEDLAIPGKPYTFRELLDAQALGDLAALVDRGRRAARVTLDELEAAAS